MGIQLNGTLPSNLLGNPADVDDFFRIDLGCTFRAPYDGQIDLIGGQERTSGVEIYYSLRRVPNGERPMIDPTFTFRDMNGLFFTKIPRGTHSLIVREPVQLRFRLFNFVFTKNFVPGYMHPIGDLSQAEVQSVTPLTDLACVLGLL
jgi:hypothetical protein